MNFRHMRALVLAIVMVMVLGGGLGQANRLQKFMAGPMAPWQRLPAAPGDELQTAYTEQMSGFQVAGEGDVQKLLPDGNDGSRHQRFILRFPSGQTLLVARNTDLAPRIDAFRTGDVVALLAAYPWNLQGLIHGTHRDPDGRQRAGRLMHAGVTYW